MLSNTLVSVIIPTKNGASTIAQCLQSIAKQTHKNIEVLIIDSGSEDDTIDICLQYPFVHVIEIPSQDFNHGATRNLGVSLAKGDFIWLTVQDACASSESEIEKMLAHFNADKDVVGVCGQQIVPHDADKNPHEWFRPYSKPSVRTVQVTDPLQLKTLSPEDLHSLCSWDNVNAMYRRNALIEYPFENVRFGEDMRWAKRVVIVGKKIVYDFNCRVYHYHHSTYDYTYRRTLTVLYHTFINFGYLRKLRYGPFDYLKVIYRNFKYKVSPLWITFNWKRMSAIAKAYNDAAHYLSKGDDALVEYHNRICGFPPQGKQN